MPNPVSHKCPIPTSQLCLVNTDVPADMESYAPIEQEIATPCKDNNINLVNLTNPNPHYPLYLTAASSARLLYTCLAQLPVACSNVLHAIDRKLVEGLGTRLAPFLQFILFIEAVSCFYFSTTVIHAFGENV